LQIRHTDGGQARHSAKKTADKKDGRQARGATPASQIMIGLPFLSHHSGIRAL